MTIIAAVDRTEVQRSVIVEAAKLASALETSLHVLHVLDRSTFRELERTSVVDSGATIELETIRGMAADIAREAAANAEIDADPVGLVGSPAKELLKYADQNDTDYIVIGGRKRSAIGKVLFGSVTQSVLLGTSVPVLTVMGDDER